MISIKQSSCILHISEFTNELLNEVQVDVVIWFVNHIRAFLRIWCFDNLIAFQ